MSGIMHTLNDGAWIYCRRCDRKVKARDGKWQRGVLLCPPCVDVHLLGYREPGIALVLSDGKQELVPVPILRDPDQFEEAEDFIL